MSERPDAAASRALPAPLARLALDETLTPDATQAVSRPAVVEAPGAALRTLDPEALPRLDIGPSSGGATPDLEPRRVLGEGGMGVVELARQRSLQRDVAIKRVRDADRAGPHVQALLSEAMYTGSLEHPNIVPVHALGCDARGQPLMVMKRVEGVSWRALIRDPQHAAWQGREGARVVRHVEILMAVCNAAHFAHSRGILHRDIKPENVMVGAFGEVYLLDWGVAMRLEAPEADGRVRGTPAYMAPEMLVRDEGLDARTDVYLLGASLHEALTGAPRHAAATLREAVIKAYESAAYVYDADVPEELGALCNQACARDPDARPSSALALRQLLERYLDHRASSELVEAAAAQLVALEAALEAPERDPREVHRAFNEARFGCAQALRAWPENARAARTLEAALRRMIDHELEHRNAGAAAALIDELSERDPALMARLEALRGSLAADASTRERLARLEREEDASVSLRERVRVMRVLMGVLGLGIPAVVALHDMAGASRTLMWRSVVGLCALSAALIALGVVKRDVFLRTRLNRRSSGMLVVGLLSLAANRALSLSLGDPVTTLLTRDALMLVVLGGVGGVLLRPLFGVMAGLFAVVCVLGVMWPAHTPLYMVGGAAASMLVLLWDASRRLRALRAQPPRGVGDAPDLLRLQVHPRQDHPRRERRRSPGPSER